MNLQGLWRKNQTLHCCFDMDCSANINLSILQKTTITQSLHLYSCLFYALTNMKELLFFSYQPLLLVYLSTFLKIFISYCKICRHSILSHCSILFFVSFSYIYIYCIVYYCNPDLLLVNHLHIIQLKMIFILNISWFLNKSLMNILQNTWYF